VPPPPGQKPASAYSRFIPREELGEFAAWKPGAAFDRGGPAGATAAAEPAAPTEADWQARVQAARQAGYHDGYRDGLVALEGFKQSFATQATSQVGRLLESFDAELLALEHRMADAVAAIAVELARQVLRSELAGDPALVARVAAEAVQAVMLSARHITVHAHPQDLPLIAEGAAEAIDARRVRLQARGDIERGGVVVESDVGAVDARIATRWAQAAAAFGADGGWDGSPEGSAGDPPAAAPREPR
jgi:flagellar assembly protein FliH